MRDAQQERDEAARAKLALPFYLYEGKDFDDGSWFEPCTRGLRGEKVHEGWNSGTHTSARHHCRYCGRQHRTVAAV